MSEKTLRLKGIASRHERVVVIVSPPRCGSTPLSRVFWEHPSFRYYCHEPFECAYFDEEGFNSACEKLQSPTDLAELKMQETPHTTSGLVIKEMPYQVGDNFPHLIAMSSGPIVFLLRNPMLSVHSRYRKKLEAGQKPVFPVAEMGFELVSNQIAYCRDQGIPFLIVDSEDIRNKPNQVLSQVFERLDLSWSSSFTKWKALPHIDLDNLDGRHTHLYTRVLQSTGIQPNNAPPRTLEDFPVDNGFRDHVAYSMNIYETLRADPARIKMENCSAV